MWDFIEQVSVITVDKERHETIRENLETVGIRNYKLYTFKKKGKRNAPENIGIVDILKYDEKSCGDVAKELYKSHIKLIRDAYYDNKNTVLVLEDDARFIDTLSPEKIKRIGDWLTKNTTWEAFYFGGLSWGKCPISIPVTRDIMKCYNALCGHSILFSRRGMKKIIDEYDPEPKVHVDRFYDTVLKEKYICFPNINYQETDPALFSDAVNIIVPKGKNIFTPFVKIYNWISYYFVIILIITIITIYIYRRYIRMQRRNI